MSKNKTKEIIPIPDERIIGRIYYIRGEKVIFDRDLAVLYGVETKVLNQAVRRNKKRFPEDFMFKLSKNEMEIWKSQVVISNISLRSQFVTSKSGGQRYESYVFTESGIAMLSSVLKSNRAIEVNIQIMRTLTKMRRMLATHKELREKIEKMEQKYDKKFKVVFDVIVRFLKDDSKNNEGKIIGFTDKK